MTLTLCTTFGNTSFPLIMDYNRNSNHAGSPLPSIPRRTSSSRSAHAHSISEPTLASFTGTHAPATLIVHPPTPPPDLRMSSIMLRTPDIRAEPESDSSVSSSQSDEFQPIIMVCPKRVRGQRSPPMSSAEHSTPTPSAKKSNSETSNRELPVRGLAASPPLSPEDTSDGDTPRGSRPIIPQKQSLSGKLGRLCLNIEPLHNRHVSESHVNVLTETQSLHPPATASAIIPSAGSRHVRTKSGRPIKSSLKSARRPGLTVAIENATSKSEPNTPTHSKAVHFDAQLEHVKLFLAEQKPLAVSRDGSPTDTSGTDSEFPDFIYGNSDEEGINKVLVMQVINMPKKINRVADVVLLELTLSQDSMSINGRVRVKNIAFEKWLAVRFTFDWWQTTSEVTARYIESVENNAFDVFGFTIRFNDIMARIEEKALFLALRYTVAGKEIWDNNGGQNYLAKFTKTKVQPQKATSDEEVTNGNTIQHLNNKLEQVVEGRHPTSSFLAERIHRQARLDAQKLPTLQAEKSLSARYDLSASLKNNPWPTSVPPSSPFHHRTNTFPSSNTIPWPQKMFSIGGRKSGPEPRSPRTSALGSPGLDDLLYPRISTTADDAPFELPPPARRESRNHQRGYFDSSVLDTSDVKITPPCSPLVPKRTDNSVSTSPSSSSQLPRFNSFPPSDSPRTSPHYNSASVASFVPAWATSHLVSTGGSEDSTPSISSGSSSSRSTTPSPTDEFRRSVMTERGGSEGSDGNGCDNYSSFLDRCVSILRGLAFESHHFIRSFCFYTGNGNSLLDIPSEELPRSQSASSIEEFLFQSPPTNTFAPDRASPSTTPTRRSPSLDETTSRSGSSTPTAGSFLRESCSITSIMI